MTYKQYYHFVNLVRMERKIPISDLCEGIISERTFMRYLQSPKPVKYDTLTKLCQRLNIETYQVVHNALFFRSEGNSTYKFIYRIQIALYHDIHQHYLNVLSYREDSWFLASLVDSHVAKYEMLIGLIDSDEYQARIETIYQRIKKQEVINAEILLIYILYLETSPDDIEEITKYVCEELLKINYFSSIVFVALAISRFIAVLLKEDLVVIDTLRKLVSKLQEINKYITTKFIQIHLALYQAYIAKLDSNSDEMKNKLYLYIANADFLYGGADYLFDSHQIEALFNVDLNQLRYSKTQEKFASSRFQII